MRVLAVTVSLLFLAACAPQGRFERAGATADEAIEDVREGVQDVVEDVRETADDVGDDVARRRRR
jgi:hypothetical protein